MRLICFYRAKVSKWSDWGRHLYNKLNKQVYLTAFAVLGNSLRKKYTVHNSYEKIPDCHICLPTSACCMTKTQLRLLLLLLLRRDEHYRTKYYVPPGPDHIYVRQCYPMLIQ